MAYCELEPGVAGLSPRHLSVSLVKILPRFMVPSPITILDALPRLSNLKIDREELDRRDQLERAHTLATATSFTVGPSNEIQMVLLDLWRDVLQRPDVGCDDDFFLVGGDSLSAIDLLHRIEEELQYQVSLTILIEAPTVRQLDGRLDIATLGAINDTIRIHTTGAQRPLFAVGGSSGHVCGSLPSCVLSGPISRATGCNRQEWTGPARMYDDPRNGDALHRREKRCSRTGLTAFSATALAGSWCSRWRCNCKRGRTGRVPRDVRHRDANLFRRRRRRYCTIAFNGAFASANSIEAISLRVTETHLRAYRDYVFDHQLERISFAASSPTSIVREIPSSLGMTAAAYGKGSLRMD